MEEIFRKNLSTFGKKMSVCVSACVRACVCFGVCQGSACEPHTPHTTHPPLITEICRLNKKQEFKTK